MKSHRGWIVLVLFFSFTAGFVRPVKSQTTETRYQFRLPHAAGFRVDAGNATAKSLTANPQWLDAWPEDGSTNLVELGSRVVLQLESADDLKSLIAGRELELSRTVTSNVFILQAPDASTAATEANRFAALPGVLASYPVLRRHIPPDGLYGQHSNDPFFIPYFNAPAIGAEWYLENIDYDGDKAGNRLGFDLNVLAAWPYTMGKGVTVALADSGLDTNHVELISRMAGAPHFNFETQDGRAGPFGGNNGDINGQLWTHGTSCAGLIGAEWNNGHGMVGVAPQASLASWVIFSTNTALVPDEQLMDMYQYAPDTVSVQNHSWGSGGGTAQSGPTLLEQIGIANAVTLSREGLGVVMVRAAGNDRMLVADADDDGYPNDPEVIAVSAVTQSGRVTSYSEPGACILVGAPGGGGDTPQGLFTLDLAGADRGVNGVTYFQPELNDYRFGVYGFIGTSASAPLISGVAALVMSANTNLSYRDVQQILAFSARQVDLADPDIVTNGAGLLVSHNAGFGIPDAGYAVWLAMRWTNRPPLTTFTMTDTRPQAIPDEGLRVEVNGMGVPPTLVSLQCFPTFGPHPDQPTAALPLVDVGVATNVPAMNLTNKGALILRDATPLEIKIGNVARAGAAFAIIYNSTNDSGLDFGVVLNTDFTTIPAVIVGNTSGSLLRAYFQTNSAGTARLHLLSTNRVFHVNSTLLCEQVGVKIQSDHPLRGDVRITLTSPQGTRSVLQRLNDDLTPGIDWTYWTTHDFFESSAGDWTVAVSDESAGAAGSVLSVGLTIRGTQITDTDHDGLDDNWEMAHFGTLAYGPKDDPDNDNYSNAREQLAGTDPAAIDLPLQGNLTPWQIGTARRMRLSWPSGTKNSYSIWSGTNADHLSFVTNIPGNFPETAWFTPYVGVPQQFYRLQAVPVP